MVAIVHPGNLSVQAHHRAAIRALELVFVLTLVGETHERRIKWSVHSLLAVDLFKISISVVIPTLAFVLIVHFWYLKPKNRGYPAVPNNRLECLTEG